MAVSFKERLTWRKLLTQTVYLSYFRKPQPQTRSYITVMLGCMINYPLYDAIHKKTDFT